MQALIDFIIRNLLALWPIARIYTWQQGVRIRCGHLREELGPGLHWRWWFIDEVNVWPRTDCTIDLGVGAITTSDGRAIAISANVTYRLVSIRQMWGRVWNTEKSLRNLALGILTSTCATYPRDVLHRDRPAVEQRLIDAMNAVTEEWGILVLRVHLTDFVEARPIRLFGDGFGQGAS